MATYKKGNFTIKNFGFNKGAAINYFNNVKDKEYIQTVCMGFNVEENGYCVQMIYRKK